MFQFIWRPYISFEHELPENYWNFTATTYLICFTIVEWHAADRVKLQFGLPQDIPDAPMDMRLYHKLDRRFRQSEMNLPLNHWSNRHQYTLVGIPSPQILYPTVSYVDWLQTINPHMHIGLENCYRCPPPPPQPQPQPEPEQPHTEHQPHQDTDDFSFSLNSQNLISQLQNDFSHIPSYNTTQPTPSYPHMFDLNTPQQNIIQPPPYSTPGYHGYGAGPSNTSLPHYGYGAGPSEAGTSNPTYPPTNYPPINLEHVYSPPPPDEFNFIYSPQGCDGEFSHQNLCRLSMTSTENEPFLDSLWPGRRDAGDNVQLTQMSLGQSSQMPQPTFDEDEDDFDPPQAHRQRTPQPAVRRNPPRNAPPPWCGSYRQRQ